MGIWFVYINSLKCKSKRNKLESINDSETIEQKQIEDNSYSSFLTDLKFPNINSAFMLKQEHERINILNKSPIKDEKLKLSTSQVLVLQGGNINRDLIETPSFKSSKYETKSPDNNRFESKKSDNSGTNDSENDIKLDLAVKSNLNQKKKKITRKIKLPTLKYIRTSNRAHKFRNERRNSSQTNRYTTENSNASSLQIPLEPRNESNIKHFNDNLRPNTDYPINKE